MSHSDYIQLALAVTNLAVLLVILRQMILQRRTFLGQMLKDRFDMYWRTIEPVSDQAVSQLMLVPEDYMDVTLYEKHYKSDLNAIRKYIYILQLYEYLAFTFGLKRYKLPDPLGYEWTEKWTKDLLAEKEFLEVHQYHKHYYPHFSVYVDGLLKRKGK